jgi:hypothetical protein
MEHLIDKLFAASRDWPVIFETYQAATHLYLSDQTWLFTWQS